MPRSIWSGSISFGLVNVPVKAYTAVRSKDVRFNQLHATDGGRIQQKRVCSLDGEEVPYDDIVKGYDLGGGRYVVIEPAELEALDPEATHTIDIEDFVDLAEIDPLYFDASYYLAPDERGGKAYRLLYEAMEQSGRVGIARVVMRTKQYLVAVRPIEGALVMTTLNYADEVVAREDVDGIPEAAGDVNEREVKMAAQLIEALASDWEPARYVDTYREKVLDLIERKAEGEEVVAATSSERPAPVVDLMAALEASLRAARGGDAGGGDGASGADAPASSEEAAETGEPAEAAESKKKPAARRRKAS